MISLSLRHRLLLLTLLPSTLIAIGLVSYFTLSAMRTLEGELHNKGLATVRYLAPLSEYGLVAGKHASLHALAQATTQEPGVKAAIIVNQKGRQIAASGRISLPAPVLRESLEEPSEVGEGEDWVAFGAPIRRFALDAEGIADAITASEAVKAQATIGHIFVELDKEALLVEQRGLLQRGLAMVFFGLFMLGVLAIVMADHLAYPVLRLVKAIHEISAGHFGTRVPADSSGEIGVLEQGFNEMAGHIEEAHQSMQARIEEATAQLAYQARHDPLTGLLNRREFDNRLEQALLDVREGGDECCLLFIDLDRFKPVNDRCGHQAGDELLQQIGQLLEGRLREHDTLARIGGDEFAILLANCSRIHARRVAEDLCNLTSAYRFIWQDKVFAIGASIGICPITPQIGQIGELVAAADLACQRAKAAGRNQVCETFVQAAQDRRNEHGTSWATRIASAVSEGALRIEVLPCLALQTDDQAVTMVEITARLEEAGRPEVALPALIDAAERYDVSHLIDDYLLQAALDTLKAARLAGRRLTCLVPISGAALSRRALVDHLARCLREQPLEGNRLYLMLPETDTLQRSGKAIEFAQNVRGLGCGVALQDFGGSISSLSHLQNLGPACVKLNRSLTHALDGNRAATALLRAVQEITADQGIASLAEGVDTPEAINQLRALGIDYASGKAVASGQGNPV